MSVIRLKLLCGFSFLMSEVWDAHHQISLWSVSPQTHAGFRLIYTQTAMWRSAAHRCTAPSSFHIPNHKFSSLFPPCPLSSRNVGLISILSSVGAPVTSCCVAFLVVVFVLFFHEWRRVSRFHVVQTLGRKWCLEAHCCSHRRFTYLKQTGLETWSTKRRRWQVGAHSCPAGMLHGGRVHDIGG